MKNYKEYARHIQEEIYFLDKQISILSFQEFVTNEAYKRAAVRSLEIIGEAVKKLPNEILTLYPQTEWKNIARTRDKLIHHYFGIDYDLVWDIIVNHIPQLKIDIEKILS